MTKGRGRLVVVGGGIGESPRGLGWPKSGENHRKRPKIPEKSSTYEDSGRILLTRLGQSNFSESFRRGCQSGSPGGQIVSGKSA
jgi:hypothetical protein